MMTMLMLAKTDPANPAVKAAAQIIVFGGLAAFAIAALAVAVILTLFAVKAIRENFRD